MYRTIVASLLILACASCIKDPPLNPEADIESFTVDKQLLLSDVFIDQVNGRIVLQLTDKAYADGLAPVITTSIGSRVQPASGESIHFTDDTIRYVVSSEDGAHTKTYRIELASIGKWKFDFEHWGLQDKDKYEYLLEEDGSSPWTSGNPGVALSGVNKDPSAYPTRSTTDHRFGAKAAELETLKGTALSGLAGIKLFAGSLFTGTFNSTNALIKPLEATQFGQPFGGRPQRFTGYFKYTAGPNFQNKEGVILPGIRDSCSIYAVLFKGNTRLDATNINTSDRIVAVARLKTTDDHSQFTRFDLPFEYNSSLPLIGKHMLAIVVSSSQYGDSYQGAIGSRLVVDSLNIIY
ncbi:PCMD domain-containing protein [Paraflavitalea speifideaquila]|uniref:PCMD domain-containing protein n=1 Tax=Paraflavitalea speifideaquila TaxID=3076558 RepID=UPI0028EF63BA|nr:PCMD domain-containing protein [Paraflavitalea speifideiaquila]